jgi:hypothetical protein
MRNLIDYHFYWEWGRTFDLSKSHQVIENMDASMLILPLFFFEGLPQAVWIEFIFTRLSQY